MSIQYLKPEQIDRQRWDNCIAQSFNSLIYGYSWYLDEVCQEWHALVINDYQAVMPLPIKKTWGLTLSRHPLFAQQLGIFSQEALSEAKMNEILAAIPKHIQVCHLQLNAHNRTSALPQQPNYLLNLIQDYPQLAQGFSSNCTRNIKKSYKNSCELLEGVATKELMGLFRWQMDALKANLNEEAYQTIERIINTCVAKGCADTIGVYSPVNHLCGAVVLLRDQKRLYYLVAAFDSMGHEFLASYRILDYILKKYSGKDLILDFEGSKKQGLQYFYSGFGATKVPFPIFTRFKGGLLNPILKRLFSPNLPTMQEHEEATAQAH